VPAPTLYGTGHERREASERGHRPLVGGALCLDFVNTASTHGNPAGGDELAPGYVNVVSWFRFAGAVDEPGATRLLRLAHKEPREAAAARKRIAALREALYGVTLSLAGGEPPDPNALALVNEETRRAFARRALVAGDDGLAWDWSEEIVLDRPLWPVCQSLADLLTGQRVSRIRQCAAPDCQALFVDASKNGSRRYCSTAGCGTAERVRRFRARQRLA